MLIESGNFAEDHAADDIALRNAGARCLRGAAWLDAWRASGDLIGQSCLRAQEKLNQAKHLYVAGQDVSSDTDIAWDAMCSRVEAAIFRRRGIPSRAVAVLKDSVQRLAECGGRLCGTRQNLLLDQGDIWFSDMQLRDARECFEQVLAMDESQSTLEGAGARKRLGDVDLWCGKPKSARTQYIEARRCYNEFGYQRGVAVANLGLGICELVERRHRQSEEALTDAMSVLKEARAWNTLVFAELINGFLLLDQGRRSEASGLFDNLVKNTTASQLSSRLGRIGLFLSTITQPPSSDTDQHYGDLMRLLKEALPVESDRLAAWEIWFLHQLTIHSDQPWMNEISSVLLKESRKLCPADADPLLYELLTAEPYL